tara:strand:+ start:5090 stop:5968 length:879 start_codon:yes stop_codon:yes gene_type:complete
MLSAAVVASVFKPSDLSNLVAWYDALDSSTITSDSDGVSAWNDKSGNNYHGTQTTNSKKPALGTSADNGLVALNFTNPGAGSGSVLATSNPIWSYDERTTFVVCTKIANSTRTAPYMHNYFRLKSTESCAAGILFAGDGTDSSFGDHTDEVYGAMGLISGNPSNTAQLSDTADGVDVLVRQSYKLTASGVSGDFMTAQKNAEAEVTFGGTVTNLTTATDAADGQTKNTFSVIGLTGIIGGYVTSFTNSSTQSLTPIALWSGSIQEICDYNRALSDAEMNQVMGYLLGKWRVT